MVGTPPIPVAEPLSAGVVGDRSVLAGLGDDASSSFLLF
jgi:hypothetical protein